MKELAFLQQGRIAQQQILEDGSLFPMVLLPPDENPSIGSLLNAIQRNKEWIDSQLRQAGPLLFRGFPLRSAADFNAVVEAFGWKEHPYLGFGSRTRIEGRVYTANEAPLDQPIKFHHEMAMVCYVRCSSIQNKMGPLVSIRTVDRDTDQRKAWFNPTTLALKESAITLGDGSLFPEEAIEPYIQITEEECVDITWEVGDVLVLDNRFVQHARRPSTPPRRVLVAFCK